MRSIELALYADALAGETAAVAARVERTRSQLRHATIERAARRDLDGDTVERLQQAGFLRPLDERALREHLDDQLATLEALERLQAWVERQLREVSEA